MNNSRAMILITHIALRIGVIAFLFAFFYDIIGETDPNTPFWEKIFSIDALFLLVIVASSVLLLVLDKRKFEVFGFFLVFVICLYRILSILFELGFSRDISIHFLLIVLSFYLLTKPYRMKHHAGA